MKLNYSDCDCSLTQFFALADAVGESVRAFDHEAASAHDLTDLTPDEAADIEGDNPALIYLQLFPEPLQISELRTEAGEVGDRDMIALCDRASAGDDKARDACAEVILDAAAMAIA